MERADDEKLNSYLEKFVLSDLRRVSKEAVKHFGEERALYTISEYQYHWMNLLNAIVERERGAAENSATFFHSYLLGREINNIQFLLLSGDYWGLNRNLRYVWEMMAKAHYADASFPSKTIDEKMEELEGLEKQKNGAWARYIEPALNRLSKDTKEYRSLWGALNMYVHPDIARIRKEFVRNPSVQVISEFDENLAKESLAHTEKILALCFEMIYVKFPAVAPEQK